jgi:hypothetical protein
MGAVTKSQIRQAYRRLESAMPKAPVIPIHTPKKFIQHSQDLELDEWQDNYITQASTQKRVAIVACRQSGKSTVTAGFVAWCMTYIPFFVVLIASRSLRQASHYLEKVAQSILTYYPRKSIPSLNKLSIGLPNASQAISIPCQNPDTARGFSPQLVILDEAAFAPEALLAVITPSLAATQGGLHMLSSANGPQGFFYHACEGENSDDYFTLKIPSAMCPRITAEFLDLERRTLGDIRFRSEYEAEFLSAEGAFFGYDALNALQETETPSFMGIPGVEDDIPTPEELHAAREDLAAAFDFRQRVDKYLYD